MVKAGDIRATVVQRRKRSIKKGFNGGDRSQIGPWRKARISILQGEEAGGHSR